MKKKVFLLLLLLLVPTIVFAKDTCNDNDIKIKSIILKDTKGFSEEIQESSINNNTINLNLKMYDVGDSSTYDITVENTSNEDYYFTKDSMKLENDYLEYNLKNDSELIPAKEEKTIELKVSYKNQIPNDNYSDTSKLIISLSDKPLENPKTKMTYTFIFIIISLIAITIYTKINNKSFSKKKLLLIGTLLSIIPLTTTALCTVNLSVETKIEIENKEAIFLPGQDVNIKMKELAGNDTSTETNRYNFKDENIVSIIYSNTEPSLNNKENKNIVSTSDSPYPIYMWYEDNTIYWWSEDIHPSLNKNSADMFDNLSNLNDISGLKEIDSSLSENLTKLFRNNSLTDLTALNNWNIKNVKSLQRLLYGNASLTSLSGLENWNISNVEDMAGSFELTNIKNINELKNWDTSNVKNMRYTFEGCKKLESIAGLENWNTSKVEDMAGLFKANISLNNFDSIKNWDVKKVKTMEAMFAMTFNVEEIDLSNWETSSLEDMQYMFAQLWLNIDGQYTTGGKLKRIILSDKFDSSKVTNMIFTFYNNRVIEDYEFLKYLDTSNVKDMYHLFYQNYGLKDTEYVKDWDVSNVENMGALFIGTKNLSSLEGLRNWNTSSATDMSYMFRNCTSLASLSGLENWNISNVTNYNYMFDGTTSLSNTSFINDWNIQNTATFSAMFRGAITHPEFTKVQGTWSNGTFTPTQ